MPLRMAFEAGTRLGPYEIVAPLGAGGMGEVYRARDTRLDRTVAVKVLTGRLAADAESRQRFEGEARAIAALNDPHICGIYDVGRHADLDYLVLEHLEGETLADRLQRAPQLTVEEALAIAIQIGDALHHAHRAGIVHRDLKPGNVMLVRRAGPSGAPDVKLLDFGLAARTAAGQPQGIDAALLATVAPSQEATRASMTPATGGFSGTVQYMAPEQLGGAPGDHRADIFAFGCVLYEMLAGRKAFDGANAMTVIAAIVGSEPPALPALQVAHPFLDHVLRRCLEKDPERRWQSIGDVAGELRWIAGHPPAIVSAGGAPTRMSRAARAALGSVLVLAALAAAAGVRAWRALDGAGDRPALRFEISTAPTDDPSIALSPDGRQIAFVGNQARGPVLWVRSLDALENRALPGTEGASLPFWSADGRTIGFFAQGKLKRVDVAGGLPLVIADAPNARGGAWSSDGIILFASGVGAPIKRVSTSGGPVQPVTRIDAQHGPDHRWPQFLPDGKRFLFSSWLGTPETNGIYLGSIDGTAPVRVLPSDGPGRFAAPDMLLTIRQGTLEAYRFDVASASVKGEPVVVAQGFTGAAGSGGFASSDTGVLAYRTGTGQRRQLVWVNRQGAVLGTIAEPEANFIAAPELSADEQSVAVFLQRGGDNDIWVIDLARNLARRITNGPPADAHPLWDPDGQHLVFYSRRFAAGGAARQALSGGAAEPFFPNGETGQPLSWTRNGRYVLVRRNSATSGADLAALAVSGERSEVEIARSQSDETEGQFSPDGKWVAFVSNESGGPEVYVQSFPDGRARTQVSTAGGAQVRWSGDGKEIFYVAPDDRMMAVSIALGGTPDPKAPVPLFQTHLASGINVLGSKPQYAVSRDGRFLLDTAVESASAPIVVSLNWTKPLER